MRNRFAEGESLEIIGPSQPSSQITVTNLQNSDGEAITEAIRVQEHVSFSVPFSVEEYALVRRKIR